MSTLPMDGQLESEDGTSLAWWGSLPAVPPRAVVVIVHGALEHSRRYTWVADQLNDAGYAAYAIDLRGHGRSGGTPGYVPRMSALGADAARLVELARERHPDLPLFMLGHSLGGLVALEYLRRDSLPLDGLVLSGTGIDVSAVPVGQKLLAKAFSSIAPRFGLLAFDGEGVSRDPEVLASYRNDPLNFHGKVPMRTVGELFASPGRLIPWLPSITLPLLVLHGGADPVARPAGSTMIHDRVSSADKELKLYPDLYHEILNEPERQDVMNDIRAWLDERTEPALSS